MAREQFSLFDDSVGLSDADSRGLTLVSRLGERLTKAQQTFNRLVKKVEAVRSNIEHETKRLDDALAYYGKHLHPRLQRQSELRKQLVRALAPYLDERRLKGKRDRSILREVIADELAEIPLDGAASSDEDLRALFERIHGRGFEEVAREEFEEQREEIESMFDDLGIDVDLSGIEPGMSKEAMARKAAETMARLRREFEEREQSVSPLPRGKTQRQMQKEERERMAEELRKKTVATIYKQLARVLHPDLELDSELKDQKQILMQELTVAYRNNDMHTLLRLELEWIQREEGNIERLTEEKLAVYNQTLKEQVQNLEQELNDLPCHPRYQPIADFDGPFGITVRTDGPAEARAIDEVNESMEDKIRVLESTSGLETLRSILREYREEHRARKRELRYFPF
jgi:hypothetical protein